MGGLEITVGLVIGAGLAGRFGVWLVGGLEITVGLVRF